MTAHLTVFQRNLARRLHSKGRSLREIAAEIGCSHSGIDVMLRGQSRGPKPDIWIPRKGALTALEREEISIGISQGFSLSEIARSLQRSPSTITREVNVNGGRDSYRIWPAHLRAQAATKRPKSSKLSNPVLSAKVTSWLKKLWSPEEIANRLKLEFSDSEVMRVSHETIYKALYVQGRGELRRELARCLRSQRTHRKPQGQIKSTGPIADMVMISERPQEAEDRAVPGHWEGDLIIGKGGKSAVGTLVERSTRFLLLLHLPDGHSAVAVETAMQKAIKSLPRELMKSITWDQGSELARHKHFSIETGIPVYFCNPHSPWQRGTNENTNGLLRQYMPKGVDLNQYSAKDLQKIQRSLNGRPRKTLGYRMPGEKLAELVALST